MTSPYNPAVKAAIVNRVLLFLGFLGIVFSGALTGEKLFHISLPCGPSRGCDVIANHPSSMVFGLIPTAAFGLAAYLVLTALAIGRQLGSNEKARSLAPIGFFISLLGTVISIGLQVYSLTSIRAFCPWCFGSAVTMTLTFIGHAVLNNEYEKSPDPIASSSKVDSAFIAVLALLAFCGVGYALYSANAAAEGMNKLEVAKIKKADLVPTDAHILGDVNAPVTVVEFSDICCPTCQAELPKMKEFVENHPGKIRLVHRQFYIPRHTLGSLAAAMAEYAGEKGRFWDFTLSAMAGANHQELQDPTILWQAAKSVGLDEDDIRKRLSNTNDPIFERVTRDKNAANELGVQGTPTFILVVNGKDPKPMSAKELWAALNDPAIIPPNGK